MGTQGYDMEEIPTGAFKGYCVQLPYDQQNSAASPKQGWERLHSASQAFSQVDLAVPLAKPTVMGGQHIQANVHSGRS